jgi:hypothetical protein
MRTRKDIIDGNLIRPAGAGVVDQVVKGKANLDRCEVVGVKRQR